MTRPDLNGLSADEKRALLARILKAKTVRGDTFPLSFQQQRLWFLDQMEPGNTAYSIISALRMRGPLDTGAMERAVADLLREHGRDLAVLHPSLMYRLFAPYWWGHQPLAWLRQRASAVSISGSCPALRVVTLPASSPAVPAARSRHFIFWLPTRSGSLVPRRPSRICSAAYSGMMGSRHG